MNGAAGFAAPARHGRLLELRLDRPACFGPVSSDQWVLLTLSYIGFNSHTISSAWPHKVLHATCSILPYSACHLETLRNLERRRFRTCKYFMNGPRTWTVPNISNLFLYAFYFISHLLSSITNDDFVHCPGLNYWFCFIHWFQEGHFIQVEKNYDEYCD